MTKIDLNDILFGPTPSWEDIVEFFRDGEFHEEHYQKQAIRKHLMTEDQKDAIRNLGISLSDMLHGRYNSAQEAVVKRIFGEWNEKLGFVYFGARS